MTPDLDPDAETIEARLRAVERALADGTELPDRDLRTTDGRDLSEVTRRLDALEERVTELEAGLQAVRGYVGDVRNVNREVERRADAALAAAEELEGALDGDAPDRPTSSGGASPTAAPTAAREQPRGTTAPDSRIDRTSGTERERSSSPLTRIRDALGRLSSG